MIAPAFRANYPDDYGRILGGLKKLGVKRFINVAFGADISTWGLLMDDFGTGYSSLGYLTYIIEKYCRSIKGGTWKTS